ncbi:MAG TPA: biotin/lipoyl-binding protein [Actinobacteria bacterium]|nr:biotin/lipoyl-binding protein [Actinomycetota bacterium]
MIRRLLIANRGEIACRIAATARRLGIDTVGVYAPPDEDALHVRHVDLAVPLEGEDLATTYLDAAALVAAARRVGADAVHPGYGFLAEDPRFARAVIEAGLRWVGPTPDQMERLGDKLAVKALAAELGVDVGAAIPVAADDLPEDVSFPVLVKAAAGGGGRGMRLVTDPADLPAAVAAASREAAVAFGDGRVFLEPYLAEARHVEVQILGDGRGGVVHLGDRDCSIQRRNQKLVEEAPAPALPDDVRERLHATAVLLAREVGYESAGTVEFLVDADGRIDLLEVNTRLQVEHPVTEAITGLDLVELQLRVAAGEGLPEEIRFDGHAVEARLVAEDPAADWRPQVGTITVFDVEPTVRVDAGVAAGGAVRPDYDSLLAKVIAHGPDRATAIGTLRRALRTALVGGIQTNLDALVRILDHPAFRTGAVTTRFLAAHPEVLEPVADPAPVPHLAAAAVLRRDEDRRADPWSFAPTGWRNLPTVGQRSTWEDGRGGLHHLEEAWHGDDEFDLAVGPWPEPGPDGELAEDARARHRVRVVDLDGATLRLDVDGLRHRLRFGGDPAGGVVVASVDAAVELRLRPRLVSHEPHEASSGPIAPLPGTVLEVAVRVGDEVEAGDLLVTIEAMKMEHRVVADRPAAVVEVLVAPGDRVDVGEPLVRFADDG